MYEHVYDFNSRPFTSTPFVKHYFAGESIQQALGQSRICIDRASGPVIVVGATGTGKSLMLAMLEFEYQTQFNVVNLGCARLDERRDLWQSIMFELKLPFHDLSESELRFALLEYLKPSERCPNGVLLLIDEAHSLPVGLLDELRLFTNFVRNGVPRLRLVMVGSHQLEEHLTDPRLDSLNQRIAARCYLENMHRAETGRYVLEHIERVGGKGNDLFSTDSLKTIHDVTDGCPRLVNQVCDLALILAGTRGESSVSPDCIHEAWADVQSIPGNWPEHLTPSATQPEGSGDENNDDWTVIEFGQLADSPETETTTRQDTPLAFDDAEEADPTHVKTTVTKAEEPSGTIDLESESNCSTGECKNADCSSHEDSNPLNQVPLFGELPTDTDQEPEVSLDELSKISELENEQNELLANADSSTYEDHRSSIESSHGLDGTDENPATLGAIGPQLSRFHPTDLPCVNRELPTIKNEPTGETELSDESERGTDAHLQSEPAESARPAPTPQTADPFAESFAEEEYLLDRFAPFVAHHNLSSLTVTTEDLESIVPIEPPATDQAFTCTTVEPISNETSEPDPPPKRSPGVVIIEQADVTENVDTSESETSPIPLEVDDASPLADNDPTPSDATSPVHQSTYHTHSTPVASKEIEQQADEILQRLEQSQDVSCETNSPFSTDPAAPTILEIPSPEVGAPAPFVHGEPRHSSTGAGNSNDAPPQLFQSPQPSAGSEFDKQRDAIDETQRILNEILEQKNLIADQHSRRSSSTDIPNELPLEMIDFPDVEKVVTESAEIVNDDREMIIVSRMEQQIDDPIDQATPIPFPATPVSTGRAKRMNYQDLFDQLREIPENQESSE